MPHKLKRSHKYMLDILVAAVAISLIGFGLWRTFSESSGLCDQAGQEHEISMQNDAFSTPTLTVKQCDTLKIANLDGEQNYQLAFGVHDKHVEYPGFSETLVRPNEFIAIDMLQFGSYRIHDHLRDKAAIELTILAR